MSKIFYPILILCVLFWGTTVIGAPLTQDNTVQIGLLVSPNSNSDQAARLAIDELNRREDAPFQYEAIYPNQFVTQPEAVTDAIRSLNNQGAKAIIGPVRSAFALPALEPLARAGVPVMTLATADTLTEFDVTNNIMRIRAAERFYSISAADYMINDLGLTNIVLVQTNIESTEALIAYEFHMNQLGRSPSTKIQLVDNTELQANIDAMLAPSPDGIAFWGPADDVVTLMAELRNRRWEGTFFYRGASEIMLNEQLNLTLGSGMLGANGWIYSNPSPASRTFLANYAALYGKIPTDEAAAAYDAVHILANKIEQVGYEMPALYQSLLETGTLFTVQGMLSPQNYGDGDFSRMVNIYEINQFGGANLLARYANGERLPEDADPAILVGQTAALSTATPSPTPSLEPSLTPTITATPSQVQIRPLSEAVSVQSGPGNFFESIGTLEAPSAATVVGGDAEFNWFVIQYRGGIGWIENNPEQLSVFDPGGLLSQLPVIEAPPTPQGGASPTPPLEQADIIIDSVTLTPENPIPGQMFVANVAIRNAGIAPTGPFTIGATFEPGAVYSSNLVENLAPDASMLVPLSATILGSGEFAVDIIADVNNDVYEGRDGDFNNFYRINYRTDFPIVAELDNFNVPAGSTLDLAGGTVDLSWTGTQIEAVNSARIGIITGLTYDSVSYNALDPSIISAQTPLTDGQLFPGVLIGVITTEGNRAIMRVESRNGTALVLSYRVYSP